MRATDYRLTQLSIYTYIFLRFR